MTRDRVAALGLVVSVWAVSLTQLDRFPPLHDDEAWILSPGVKLFSQGVYGSDLFAGFAGMERHYFEFMPLLSVLQGAGARLWGIGVFQMRFLPVLLAVLLLALIFSLARWLAGPVVALAAALLLLGWQWLPGGARILGTGIPLVDLARLARYDVLAALLGLAALFAFIRGSSISRRPPCLDLLAGLLVGLAGLAQLYGLFWLAVFISGLAVTRLRYGQDGGGRRLAWLLGGSGLVWLPWGVYVANGLADYRAQMRLHGTQFDLFVPSFYLGNLLNEGRRYALGLRDPTIVTRAGFWLLVVGAPIALAWLAWRASRGDQAAFWLVWSCLVFPLLLALLVQRKTFDYLVTVVPLVSIALAWGLVALARRGPVTRLAVVAWLVLAVLQGSWTIVQMQRRASQVDPVPDAFFVQLRHLIAPGERVVGPTAYAVGVPETAYRSYALPFYLADPDLAPAPLALDDALEALTPDVLLMSPQWALSMQGDPVTRRPDRRLQFAAFMARHQARLVANLRDSEGAPIQVFRLSP